MATLTEENKHKIIRLYAQFKSPSEIVAALAEDGVETNVRQILSYDPTSPYCDAGEKWRELFKIEREAFVAGVQEHANANQAWRLAELHDLYKRAKKSGNTALAAQLLKQSAEEVGGVLTNERNVNHRSDDETSTDRRQKVTEILRVAMAKRQGAAGSPTVQ